VAGTLGDDDLLKRYKARQFIGIITETEVIAEFNIGLYFALVEKMTVYDGGRLIVSLLDGTAVECEKDNLLLCENFVPDSYCSYP